MLDTHIVVALFEGRTAGLSAAAKRAIDREPASFSPAVLLELELLFEIRRLHQGAAAIARYLAEALSIDVLNDRFSEIARPALDLSFTRDPFDRLIVAHAQLREATLITLDANLQRHYARALG